VSNLFVWQGHTQRNKHGNNPSGLSIPTTLSDVQNGGPLIIIINATLDLIRLFGFCLKQFMNGGKGQEIDSTQVPQVSIDFSLSTCARSTVKVWEKGEGEKAKIPTAGELSLSLSLSLYLL